MNHDFKRQARRSLAKRARHTGRMSRQSLRYAVFIGGAACVGLVSLGFAQLAELMLAWNSTLFARYAWSAFILLPCGFAGLRWLTLRHAPQARGSGIPQVIAAMSLPPGRAQALLVAPLQSLWKIFLTAAGLLVGASIGREGPSVQVGASLMWAWGSWWQRRRPREFRFRTDALIAAGAAGGLAAAFNTPLAGVVFAIEELGRGSSLRWDRNVLSGVLTAGFLSLALMGNYAYFHLAPANLMLADAWKAVALCALVGGILGGLFSKTLIHGLPGLMPRRWRSLPGRHPIATAFACGLIVAVLGALSGGTTYGTGYPQAAALLDGQQDVSLWFGLAKWGATVMSYFAGIPGGIFTPSLAIGAGLGDYVSQLFGGIADPRILVLLSMAAFLAAATQAPITASVIVMEMTRSHDLTLYLLAATLMASFIARQFSPRPFYHTVARSFRREAVALTEEEPPNRGAEGKAS